ncbi:MAG TPA: HD domain-containing phosphohydrolase [Syntrophomonadaceae bacterium]|nr:HD domain-containing phosphohydrolase [Syntrophomonadaceae bacterium]
MRRIPVEDLKPGMVVARTVVGFTGKLLITHNTALTDTYINRLGKLGIGSVYIKDGLDDIDIPEIISEQVRSSVSSHLSTSLKSFSISNSLNVSAFKKSAKLLIDNIIRNRNVLIQLEDIRVYSDYVFIHSINVAAFAIMTGLSLGYSDSNLMDLGLGALLHDIGMIAMDSAILDNPAALTNIERNQIETHPEIGFNTLRTHNVSAIASNIAFQHHEKVDGSGYPRQLKGNEILEYAKIVSVVDAFDAIISDRPYRTGCTTTDAMVILQKLAGSHFEPAIVEAFASNVAMYPVGSLLSLNTGHIAVVTLINRFNSNRPVVNVICDQMGNIIKPSLTINLSKTDEVVISKRLSYEESDFIRSKIVDLTGFPNKETFQPSAS